MTINAPTIFYSLKKAFEIAEEMEKNDPDWLYDVVDCKNGLARIDVYDENGELVHKGFGLV